MKGIGEPFEQIDEEQNKEDRKESSDLNEGSEFIKLRLHTNILGLIIGDGSLYEDSNSEDNPAIELEPKKLFNIFHNFYIDHKIDLSEFFKLFEFDLDEMFTIKAENFKNKKVDEIEQLLYPDGKQEPLTPLL